ncbi:hypothetical protein HXX76_004852 [Chlamydomonas incerta]|uniref:ADP-ribosylglycohydrolase n=1 Tax=Chlamydomonas incerta TaxID=51695 RepID=A0A835W6U2_CHLIN|nr:hypothetical protein HXX76_004852 [Chlamydomonas incerta]|eukprot:KAG2439498.1 hypothetical protein HXX76_004852 [Chlamydomonas incerta]
MSAAPVAAPAAKTVATDAAVRERAKAAVLGGLLADIATMPLHWIYDVPKMNELLASKGMTAAAPEFFPEPSCPFYQHPFGALSPYGHELIPLLQSMAANGGEFDEHKYAEAFYTYFTVQEPNAYRNRSVRNIIAAWEEGKRGREVGDKDDFQANCFAKASLLVARYAGKPELRQVVEAAVRVQQNNDNAVAYGLAGALLLEKVVLGHTIEEALTWATSEGGLPADLKALVERAVATRTTPLRDLTYEPVQYMQEMVGKHMAIKDELPPFTLAVWCNGPACGNPAAFTNVAMAAAVYGGDSGNAYVDGVRANLMAGGDNCSRSLLVGALLAAQGGLGSLPAEWRAKATKLAEYEAHVDKLFS